MLETGTGGYPAQRPSNAGLPGPYDEFDLDIRLGAEHKKEREVTENCTQDCETNPAGECGPSGVVKLCQGQTKEGKTCHTCEACATQAKTCAATCETCDTQCRQETCATCETRCGQHTCANTCEGQTCQACTQHTCAAERCLKPTRDC